MVENTKSVNEADEIDPKISKMSEKNKLRYTIKNLHNELNIADLDLNQQEEYLKSLKQSRNRESESREACVAYLQKVVESKTNECLAVQKERQMQKDLNELVKVRFSDVDRNLDRLRNTNKSLFSQQKSELEGKLSALEEKRLIKHSQLPHLERLEEEFEQKTFTQTLENREANKAHIREVLGKKQKFKSLVDDLCLDSENVFNLTLPVFAKKQISNNIRFRRICEDMSENILTCQDYSRHLAQSKNILNVENECQNQVQSGIKSHESDLSNYFESLLEKIANLEIDIRPKEVEDGGNVKQNKCILKTLKEDLSRIKDELRDIYLILEDQLEFQRDIEERLRRKIDENGLMISTVFNVGKAVKSRIQDKRKKEAKYLDVELLKELHALLRKYL